MSDTKFYKLRQSSAMIQEAILHIFRSQFPPMTVRQVYYSLTVLGIVPKTEHGYKMVVYQLGNMRENGIVPYSWIADNTRFRIKPLTYGGGVLGAINQLSINFRRDHWMHQPDYVEIWVEKDALAGVIAVITEKYDVPLVVARGYSSITAIYKAAEIIMARPQEVYIYHFGDYDPSGVDAAYNIQKGLMEHGACFNFQRVAVTYEQIEMYNLPVRPTKESDPRAKSWGNRPSVELDAIPAPTLRDMVEECIVQHIDLENWERDSEREGRDLQRLQRIHHNLILDPNSLLGGRDE